MSSAHIVAIVAIVFGTLYAIFDLHSKHKAKAKSSSEIDELKSELNSELKEVKERLAVLEKIVTDGKYDLKNEINSL